MFKLETVTPPATVKDPALVSVKPDVAIDAIVTAPEVPASTVKDLELPVTAPNEISAPAGTPFVETTVKFPPVKERFPTVIVAPVVFNVVSPMTVALPITIEAVPVEMIPDRSTAPVPTAKPFSKRRFDPNVTPPVLMKLTNGVMTPPPVNAIE
jgi:hypothetical protein